MSTPPKIVPSARTAARQQAEAEADRQRAERAARPPPPPPPEVVPPPRRRPSVVTIEFPDAPWCDCKKTLLGYYCARDKAQANGRMCPSEFNCRADRR